MEKVKGSALDAEIQIILLENVQSHRETRTKKHSLEVLRVIAVKKMTRRSKMKRVLFIRYPSVGDGNCFFRSYSAKGNCGHRIITSHLGLHVILSEYLAEEVGVMGLAVGMDVVQGATDLLHTCMINLACIPGHVDTLARSHLYPYHLQGCHLVLDVGIELLRLGTSTSFTLTINKTTQMEAVKDESKQGSRGQYHYGVELQFATTQVTG
ncbi:hypothetical protein Tco_0583880 [Tanacetum coccineum]